MPKIINQPAAVAVDLFCGAGGLTHGLVRAGLPVAAGIDLDPACQYPYEANNKSEFILADVAEVTADRLLGTYPKNVERVLVGCAPCQRFSRYARRRGRPSVRKWDMLVHFAALAETVRPTVVSMENVPELSADIAFRKFVRSLRQSGYHVGYSDVYCPDYGVPQHRTRLVLFASLYGPVRLVPPTHPLNRYRTVKDAIGQLRPLTVGESDRDDPLHRACRLSELNLCRVRASKPGGCWRDWPTELVANCHQAASGKTYPSVYGRMEWGKPSPTITTQFFGYGNGRFGHPEQDRAISLREGAILQSFPRHYRFCRADDKVSFSVLGRLIGNAVPVRLGQIIGESILRHLAEKHG